MCWALGLVSVLSFGIALGLVGFSEGADVLLALFVALLTGVLSLMHAELSDPKDWPAPGADQGSGQAGHF